MTTVTEGLFVDGTPVVRMENDFLRVDVAPGVGGRVVSLVDLVTGYEFLWHNAALKLERLAPGSEYDPNFYGGVDELLPNDIPESINGVDSPDHGELWTSELSGRVDGASLVMNGTLPINGLGYERRMTLRPAERVIDLDYRIENLTGERRVFMWKLHAALNIGPGDQIVCPARKVTVPDLEWSRWNSLGSFDWPIIEGQRADLIPPLDGTMDFLHLTDLEAGKMALKKASRGLIFEYEFDTEVFPYAWLFASFGAFLGHYTALLEPCSTMPISVAEADELGQCSVLQPGEKLETRVSIYAGPSRV